MRSRLLGRTGFAVSEIGFGCWGIGGMVAGASYGKTDDATSLAALNRAAECGITFFDTAEAYGNGHSESLLGEAFGRRDDIIIATKAGHEDFSKQPDFSPAGIRASVDRSRKRLKRERIDLLQLHNPTIEILRSDPRILEMLEDLVRSGTIRAFGISTKTPTEAATAIREFRFPVVQVNFNLADQRALEIGLLDLARETKTGIIGRTPLAFGFLSGALDANVQFTAGDHRANWSRERIREWVEAGRNFTRAIAERDRQSPALIALRFCLSYPEIGTIIPGMLKPEEVEENVRASAAGPLSAADLDGIRRTYNESSFASSKISTPAQPRAKARVMVTGTSGVLGSALMGMAAAWPEYDLVGAPHELLDLTDAAATRAFVRDRQISQIVHLAAISGGVELARRYPARILRENVAMTFSILDAAVECGVDKVVLTLSSGAYPAVVPQPNAEEQLHEGPPHTSAASYAYSKRLIDPAIRAYRQEHGLKAVGLVPSGIFGENDNFNPDDCTWIAGLIRRFCEWTPEQGDVVVWGDGSPIREITDARDMARAFMWALANYDDEAPLNVGVGEGRTIGEVAYLLAEIAEVPRERVRFDASRARGIDRRVMSNARFMARAGFTFTPLRETLERVVAWYKRTLRETPAAIRRRPRILPRS